MPNPVAGNARKGRVATGAVLALAFCGAGCASWQDFKQRANSVNLFTSSYDDPLAGQKMSTAAKLFVDADYENAQKIYKEIADNQGNTAEMAELARYMQAECRRFRHHYADAMDTYNRLLNDFPTGAHRHEACERMYEIVDFWLDDFREEIKQRQNEKGVLTWQPGWPNPSDKTRPQLDEEGRILQALEHIHTHDVTGPNADKALFWCGYISFVRGNFKESDEFFSQLVEMHKDSPLRPQAMTFAIQAKNNATGGAVYDGRKCAEALQLIHVAEATLPELTQDPQMAEKLAAARFAIRAQQAEKDFRTAEYYERTGHPGSAVFYYVLVERRYSGTRYSDLATQRKEKLIRDLEAGKVPANENDPIAIVKAKWQEQFGTKTPANPDAPSDKGPMRLDPPKNLPPSFGTNGPNMMGREP